MDEGLTSIGWIFSSSSSSCTIKLHNFISGTEVSNTFGPFAGGDTSPGQSCYAYALNFTRSKWVVTCQGQASASDATTIFILNRTTLAVESAFTFTGEAATGSFDKLVRRALTVGSNPYLIVFDAVNAKRLYFSGAAGGALLSDVVADLSARAGLSVSQYDVAALTDTVNGYAIAKQTTTRSAIDALRPAYYFDAVESDGLVKYVKRGGSIAVTVLDDDLAAVADAQAPDPLATTRKMEQELPRTIWINYILAATNYQSATKYANRLIGSSGDETTIDTPLVLLDAKAQEIAQVNLTLAWVSRQTYRFNLPPKYAYLEPTDIVAVKSKTMRITKMTRTLAGVFECEAVADDSNFYAPAVVVTETPTSGQVVATLGETTLLLA